MYHFELLHMPTYTMIVRLVQEYVVDESLCIGDENKHLQNYERSCCVWNLTTL